MNDAPTPSEPVPPTRPRVSAVVVAYGPEPWLDRCVDAVLASVGVEAEIVLVDNGGTEGAVERLAATGKVTLVQPGRNTGFAEGCDLGVAASDAPFVALVNPDAIVEPDALRLLVECAAEPGVGISTASVRLADRPELLNSAGNEIHFLGLSWSGSFAEPASAHAERTAVTAASGAGLVCRREVWEDLGGFPPEFFAYYEDADLSLRCWQRGWSVVFVPEAIVAHRYEFSRNPTKFELLEKNRLTMVLTVFGRRHLLAIAPLAAVAEVGLLAMAARDGWFPEKLRAYRWIGAHRAWLRARRRTVQSERVVSDADLAPLFVTHLQPGNLPGGGAPPAADRLTNAYWRLVRPLLGPAGPDGGVTSAAHRAAKRSMP